MCTGNSTIQKKGAQRTPHFSNFHVIPIVARVSLTESVVIILKILTRKWISLLLWRLLWTFDYREDTSSIDSRDPQFPGFSMIFHECHDISKYAIFYEKHRFFCKRSNPSTNKGLFHTDRTAYPGLIHAQIKGWIISVIFILVYTRSFIQLSLNIFTPLFMPFYTSLCRIANVAPFIV